jgi:hypothetical protein
VHPRTAEIPALAISIATGGTYRMPSHAAVVRPGLHHEGLGEAIAATALCHAAGGLEHQPLLHLRRGDRPLQPRPIRTIDNVPQLTGLSGPHTPYAIPGRMLITGAAAPMWRFLRQEPAALAPVLTAYDEWRRPLPNGELDPPARLYPIDRRGRIREIDSLAFFDERQALLDIQALLREPRT